MYRLAIALSDPERAANLEQALEPYVAARCIEVACTTTVADFDAHFDDAGFLDILMIDTVAGPDDAGTGGIDLVARRFPAGSPTQVVYVTRHLEHATAVYHTQHVYLLSDPVLPGDLGLAIEAACRELHAAENRPLAIRVEGKIQVVSPRRICYIESDRRKLHIHVGDEVITIYATLDALTRVLPNTFVRCHKSFLVNMRCIESVDSTHITLYTGETVPVSQKRRKATHDAFVAYMDTDL